MSAAITVLTVGRTRRGPALDLEAEWLKRIGRFATIERRAVAQSRRPTPRERRREEAAALLADPPPRVVPVALDQSGQPLDSPAFAAALARWRTAGPLLFIVGGPDGLADDLLSRCHFRLALSAMTLPHELALLVLLEQIYRALSGEQGHPYGKH